MILNLTGAGGGGKTGATLAVTSTGAGVVTVSNSAIGKSYSKTVSAGSTVEFKGLVTGSWTVSLSDGTTTAKTWEVEITADYALTVAYFSSTIAVTYPENSTCICVHTDGTTLTAPDTTGSATFAVPKTGTWTITITDNTDATKTKSTAVEITDDDEGNTQSITLGYELVILAETSGLTSGYSVSGKSIKPAIDISNYSTMTIVAAITWAAASGYGGYVGVSTSASSTTDFPAEVNITSTSKKTYTIDISSLTGNYYVRAYDSLKTSDDNVYVDHDSYTLTLYSIKFT